MTAGEVLLLLLRLAHAAAALVWMGGGVYYLLVVRPAVRQGTLSPEAVGALGAQFGEWAQTATLALLATGVVLMFDRLANGSGGLLYAALLALKVLAAAVAFWLAGLRPVRRRRPQARSRVHVVVSAGLVAWTLGVVLSSVWGRSA